MKKAMGIDYGARRVGVAVSDETGQYAFARTILPNNDTLLDTLAEMAAEDNIHLFVVGEADNPAGGVNTIMRRVSIFSKALEVRTELPVVEVSEAYSSAEARRALEEKVKSRKESNIPVDAAAAAIFLQSYLDKQNNKT